MEQETEPLEVPLVLDCGFVWGHCAFGLAVPVESVQHAKAHRDSRVSRLKYSGLG